MTLSTASRMRLAQLTIVLLLFGGYAACYFCRVDLAVATPLIIDELRQHGVAHQEATLRIGQIISLGVFAYAAGKIFLGGLGDFWGGRRNFLIGLGGATLFTVLFPLGGGLTLFAATWFGNRLTQSMAWAGLIKVVSKWFNYSSHGAVVGILSISYLVGDAVARNCMGLLLEQGFPWRVLFYFAAGVAALLFLCNLFFLRESRTNSGYEAAVPHPANLFGEAESRPPSVGALLLPLLRNRAFVVVCLLSFGSTIVRETFNSWTTVYLQEHAGYSASSAASLSSVFPGVGVASVLLCGWLSDRIGENGRSTIMFIGFLTAAAALMMLTRLPSTPSGSILAVITIGVIAFGLLGPYSYLGGAFALDFGGKQAGAVSSGLIDGVGYIGGILAGDAVARVTVAFGWNGVFVSLAAVCVLAAAGAGYLYVFRSTSQPARAHAP